MPATTPATSPGCSSAGLGPGSTAGSFRQLLRFITRPHYTYLKQLSYIIQPSQQLNFPALDILDRLFCSNFNPQQNSCLLGQIQTICKTVTSSLLICPLAGRMFGPVIPEAYQACRIKLIQLLMSVNKSPSKNSVSLDLSGHHLNNSSSKQKFSFPKASRFDGVKLECDSFYQIPSTRNGRSTSFGYGNKDFGVRTNRHAPEPATYNIESEFNLRKRGTSFGPGREEMAIGGPLNESMARKFVPGPGNYKIPSALETTAGVTLKSRLPDRTFSYAQKIPGPGAYGHQQFGSNRYYVTSKHVNTTNLAKMTQKSERGKVMSKTIALGPGQYNTNQSDLKKDGRYVLSKDKGSQSKVFSRSPRETLVLKHLLATPGPGSYTPFTYFGPA